MSPSGRFAAGAGWVRGRRVADNRGHEAFLDGGVEMGLPGVDRPDRGFDLLGAGVLGQVAPRSGLQRGHDRVLVGVGGQHQSTTASVSPMDDYLGLRYRAGISGSSTRSPVIRPWARARCATQLVSAWCLWSYMLTPISMQLLHPTLADSLTRARRICPGQPVGRCRVACSRCPDLAAMTSLIAMRWAGGNRKPCPETARIVSSMPDCRRSPSRDLAQRACRGTITNTVRSLRSEITPRAARRLTATDAHSCTSDVSRTRNPWLLVALTCCVEIRANGRGSLLLSILLYRVALNVRGAGLTARRRWAVYYCIRAGCRIGNLKWHTAGGGPGGGPEHA